VTTDPIDGGAPDWTAELARVEAALAARQPTRMVPDLDRITDLVDLLGSPQRSYPAIHLTGTNGKTSTARMIDALLRSFGLRPGGHTSPHLESVTERICLDGAPVTAEQFVRAYAEVAPFLSLVDARHPDPVTYFEVLTAMAFAAFADAPVDVAVLEVGLGGTWDATNVVRAQVAVLTPIALDHTALLGDTVGAIATEKAGIVHAGALVVTSQQPLEAAEVLLRRVADVGATVAREGLEFGVASRSVAVGGQMVSLQGLGGSYPEIFLPLHGTHMAANAACALAAVEAFLGGGRGALDVEAVRAGFAAVTSPGRLETVRTSPTVVLDAAHNPAGAAALATALEDAFTFDRLVGVVGMLADKDVGGVLEALEPVLHTVVLTAPDSPRAMSADELAAVAVGIFGADRVLVEPRLDDALETAVHIAEDDDAALGGAGVLVTGSVITVGAARTLLRRR
jgi:dihydrofolate synthase/folylpolyglutamate synthase